MPVPEARPSGPRWLERAHGGPFLKFKRPGNWCSPSACVNTVAVLTGEASTTTMHGPSTTKMLRQPSARWSREKRLVLGPAGKAANLIALKARRAPDKPDPQGLTASLFAPSGLAFAIATLQMVRSPNRAPPRTAWRTTNRLVPSWLRSTGLAGLGKLCLEPLAHQSTATVRDVHEIENEVK